MVSYVGILEKEPGTLWGIWFPDLPGCIAAAPTSAEVLDQVGDALAQWLEQARIDGEDLPPPRPIEDVRQDEWFAEALSKGHIPVVVPVPPMEFGLACEILNAIDEAAQRRGLSRADFLRQAVLEQAAG